MQKREICNCVNACNGECPEHLFSCPLDDVPVLKKDRSTSRIRHHQQAKAKTKSLQNAILLCSSIDRVPETVIEREVPRAMQALRNCKRYISSFSEEDRKNFLKAELSLKESNNYEKFYRKNVERSKHRI